METRTVIDWLDATFHPEYQEDYDNSGFLFGEAESDYKGALVALDLTPAVVDEAIRMGASLIVTHHPFIFSGVKRLTDATETGRMVMRLARNGISVYAAHTNLDNLSWGVNGILCEKLGLRNASILKPQMPGSDIGAGMVGELPEPMAVEDFLRKVKEVLGLPCVRVAPLSLLASHFSLRTVAVCGGSGAFLIEDALAAGADIYLTADLKYHDFQRTDGRMVLADVGHYESEQFAKEIIFSLISKKFSNFACRISETQKGFVGYI